MMEPTGDQARPGFAVKEAPFRGRLADAAYRRIKEAVESGAMPPGSIIYERHLLKDFHMSRTPVREALQRLLNEGFLRQLHRGYEIVELTRQEIINAYAVRGMLEGMAARQAASSRKRVALARLQDVYDLEIEALASEASDEELGRVIEEFHVALAASSSNDLLQSILRFSRSRTDAYRRRRLGIAGVAAEDVEDHRKVIEAIQSGNALLAELSVRMLTRRIIRELTGGELSDDAEMAAVVAYVELRDAERHAWPE